MNMLKARLYEHELEKKKKEENIENQNLILDGVIKLDLMFYTHID